MKTAIQEMIEHIQINATKFSMMNTHNMLKVIEPFLEKEKEQIIDAFEIGYKDGHYTKSNDFYNNLYNQNES